MPQLKDREPKPSLPYSESLTQALTLAQEEARKRGHDNCGTVHLLWGISQEPSAKEILESFGIITDEIQKAIPPFQASNLNNKKPSIQLSEKAMMVMELAADEAISTKKGKILPIHALIGLIKGDMKSSGPAVQLMEQLSKKNSEKLLAELRTIS